MFHEPRHIANSLNVVFPRIQEIRRLTNEFEDKLSGRYGQPQTIPVPDELDPQVPRLIFQSNGGHSQIVVSQVSVTLNVKYDGDYTTDAGKRLAYLQERVPLVYDLCQIAKAQPAFTGLTARVQLLSDATYVATLDQLVSILGISNTPADLNEVTVRLSSVVENRFFDNITIQSYREWATDSAVPVQRLSAAGAQSHGVELVHDFNDRYAYNEQTDYSTLQEAGLEIVARAYDSLDAWVSRLRAE